MRRKKKTTSFVDACMAFVRDNPELTRMVAFELGSIAGGVVQDWAKNKKGLKCPLRLSMHCHHRYRAR
jgi:hypothetical protein